MFSFHRPKVYRSSTGCCICKAKSSSSRFTDSKKYEEDFLECFKLSTPRQGEICNACVLLVKRWKKLPAGSDRNWQHVVDARAGPGMKSMTKFKSKNNKKSTNETGDNNKIKKKTKCFEREYSPVSDKSDGNEDVELVEEQEVDSLSEVDGSSRTGSPGGSDCEENGGIMVEKSRRHKNQVTKRRENVQQLSGFIDLDYWKEETICCGTIFKGMNNEIIMDPSFLKPCNGRLSKCKRSKTESDGATSTTVVKLYTSDSSSDSGYDESSNQGTLPDNNTYNNNNIIKKEQVSIEELNRQIPKITTN